RLPFLLAVSAIALTACSSTSPSTDPAPPPAALAAAQSPAPAAGPAPAEAIAGKQVYDQFCAACHNGGDETAPVLATLNTLGGDRVSTALSEDGLMALQAGMLKIGRASWRECG